MNIYCHAHNEAHNGVEKMKSSITGLIIAGMLVSGLMVGVPALTKGEEFMMLTASPTNLHAETNRTNSFLFIGNSFTMRHETHSHSCPLYFEIS